MSTDNDVKIAMLQQDMKNVKQELTEHKEVQSKLLDVLTAIQLDMSSAKGFLKAITICAAIFVIFVTGAYTVNWLQIPHVTPIQISQSK
jgi:hypothetical protein